jgi:hypothetical protein
MIHLWSLGQAGPTEGDTPRLSGDDAKAYVSALLALAIDELIEECRYMWRHVLGVKAHGEAFYSSLTEDNIAQLCDKGSRSLHNQLIIAAASNGNLSRGIKALGITQDDLELQLRVVLEKRQSEEASKLRNQAAALPGLQYTSQAVAYSVVFDLLKAHGALPDVVNYSPSNRADLETWKATGAVPAGYLDRSAVAEICPGCAQEMERKRLPLIKSDYFVRLMGRRVVSDILLKAEDWASYIEDEAPDILNDLLTYDDASSYDMVSTYKTVAELTRGDGMKKSWSHDEYLEGVGILGK